MAQERAREELHHHRCSFCTIHVALLQASSMDHPVCQAGRVPLPALEIGYRDAWVVYMCSIIVDAVLQVSPPALRRHSRLVPLPHAVRLLALLGRGTVHSRCAGGCGTS